MKYLLLLCLLPVALAAPQVRFLADMGSALDQATLKCDVQSLIDKLGEQPSEEACEDACHMLILEGHVLNFGCPLVCHGLGSLAHLFHLVPEPGEPDPCRTMNQLRHTTPANKG